MGGTLPICGRTYDMVRRALHRLSRLLSTTTYWAPKLWRCTADVTLPSVGGLLRENATGKHLCKRIEHWKH